MKKSCILMLCLLTLFSCCLTCLFMAYPSFNSVQAASVNEMTTLQALVESQRALANDLKTLQDRIENTRTLLSAYKKELQSTQTDVAKLQELLVFYYIDQLDDPSYTSVTPNGYTWYTAAESLGQIGKPAIAALINRLNTKDDYERALVLYALLLASQADNVKSFAGNDYIHTYLNFNVSSHPEQIEIALAWWNKYKAYFN